MPPVIPAVTVVDDACVGRGVRALRRIEAGEPIEICPVIVVPAAQVAHLDRTALYDYYFAWGDGAAAVALGYGSLYNHSSSPNADYLKDPATATIRIVALTDIVAGEEIRVDYSRGGTHPLWFEPLDDPGMV